jgi:hypothetical protein
MCSLETSAQEACIQVVRKCAELYNFNAEEALKKLNLTVVVAVKSKKNKEKTIKKKEFLLQVPCVDECSHKYKGKMHYTTYMKRNKLNTEQVINFAENNNLKLDMSQLDHPPKKPRTKKVKAEAVPTVVEEVPMVVEEVPMVVEEPIMEEEPIVEEEPKTNKKTKKGAKKEAKKKEEEPMVEEEPKTNKKAKKEAKKKE